MTTRQDRDNQEEHTAEQQVARPEVSRMRRSYSYNADRPEHQLIEHRQPNGYTTPSWSRLTNNHNADYEKNDPEGKVEYANHR